MNFAVQTIPFEGRRVRGTIVTCGHCSATKTIPVNTFSGSPNDQTTQQNHFIKKKLEGMGWLVGKRPDQHRCTGCYSAIKIAAKRKSESGGNVVDLPVKQDAPREMTREDRRIVFEKLNEVYVDDKTGYSAGWTDAKLASDLGVPRAWVAKVRDEMFGPEGSNEEIRATIAEAQSLLADIRTAAAGAGAFAETLQKLLGKADKIEKTILEIQQELR